jgi:uncharacterized protein YbaR (Trm112 family)
MENPNLIKNKKLLSILACPEKNMPVRSPTVFSIWVKRQETLWTNESNSH